MRRGLCAGLVRRPCAQGLCARVVRRWLCVQLGTVGPVVSPSGSPCVSAFVSPVMGAGAGAFMK